jgi:hypothetical protein
MKQIEPVTAWKNGEQLEANLLNAYIINDNLATACSFYYSLNTSGDGTESMPLLLGQVVAEGNLTMSGEDYLAWGGSNDIAFTYIAEKLNLTLIQDS